MKTGSLMPAQLVLADGRSFAGYSCGALGNCSGEVVFNTGMVGYPESLSDPSYYGQILVMTYPLIGNYGVPALQLENGLVSGFESPVIQVRGLIVADYSENYSHWRAARSLAEWLQDQGIPAMTGVDTRALTKHLREKGVMPGKIIHAGLPDPVCEEINRLNLVREVSISAPLLYGAFPRRIILVDCGVKHSIIRAFLQRGISVLRVPWDYDFTAEEAQGILISNGPGDPALCQATIAHVRRMLERRVPILGICLGAQILGLATGARTYKLKYGHRGQNQPCCESGTRRCYITSQNHGFAVDADTLPEDWREWFFNQNDGSNEGILHVAKPFFGAQFHPEASPGPDDAEFIFDMFVRAMT